MLRVVSLSYPFILLSLSLSLLPWMLSAQYQKRIGVLLSKNLCGIPWPNRTVLTIGGMHYFADKDKINSRVKGEKANIDEPLQVFEAKPRDLDLFYSIQEEQEEEDISSFNKNLVASKVQLESISKGPEVFAKFKNNHHANRANTKIRALCVIFAKAALEPTINIGANMAFMGDSCDWAIIFYGGSETYKKQICNNHAPNINVKLCKLSKYRSAFENYMEDFNLNASSYACNPVKIPEVFYNSRNYAAKNIPKSALYIELLPLLPNYDYVMMLDEDISLLGFDIGKCIDIWTCSSSPPPLIVQPLVAENTQFYPFLNLDAWKDSTLLYSEVGLVEQQVPMMSSMFLHWFIENVLQKVAPCALLLGVDWGMDRTWCPAAQQFGREVLGWKNYNEGACGIVIGSGPVHHLNTQAISQKRKNPKVFRAKGALIVELYNALFPSWIGTYNYKNIDPVNKNNFRKISELNQTCIRKFRSTSSKAKCIPALCS